MALGNEKKNMRSGKLRVRDTHWTEQERNWKGGHDRQETHLSVGGEKKKKCHWEFLVVICVRGKEEGAGSKSASGPASGQVFSTGGNFRRAGTD